MKYHIFDRAMKAISKITDDAGTALVPVPGVLMAGLLFGALEAGGDWDGDQRLVAMYSKGLRRV